MAPSCVVVPTRLFFCNRAGGWRAFWKRNYECNKVVHLPGGAYGVNTPWRGNGYVAQIFGGSIPNAWGVFSKSANRMAGVRPSPGAATTKLRNRHQSSETVGGKFIAVAGDGHTPHFENTP